VILLEKIIKMDRGISLSILQLWFDNLLISRASVVSVRNQDFPLMYGLRYHHAATVELKEKFFLNLLLSLSSVRFQEGAKWFSSNLEMAV